MSRSEDSDHDLTITGHAAMRWAERMPHATVDVETAWTAGIMVNAPECDCDSAKLYPPEDALLLRKNDQIVTVLPADYARLETTDLVWCANCGCSTTLQRSWNQCEWCGEKAGTESSDGNIYVLG